MKRALWILGTILLLDLLYVSYFWVWRASYYFSGNYETAFEAAGLALLIGLPIFGAFVALLVVVCSCRKKNGFHQNENGA
jgi:hypothetical protein